MAVRANEWVPTCLSSIPLTLRTIGRLLKAGENYLKAYGWSPDDRRVVFCDFVSNTVSTLWVFDMTSGEKTLLSAKRGRFLKLSFRDCVLSRIILSPIIKFKKLM